MVKLDENVKALFAAMRSMASKSIAPARKSKLRAEVYRLIELVPVDSTNTSGHTLLDKATDGQEVDLVRHLVQKGANINGLKRHGLTPFLAACQSGNVEIMTILLDAGADLHESRSSGWAGPCNALRLAICSRRTEAVRLLLARGLKTYGNLSRNTPLHTAAYHVSAPILLLLIEHGVGDISALDDYGFTALQRTAQDGGNAQDITASLTVLLDHGAAIDQLSRGGSSALHYAVMFLLGRGANVALVDRNGQTALHKARSAEMVTALLAKGALVDAVDKQGMTPLHRSAGLGDEAAVPAARALLQAGAGVNATDKKGDVPLHLWAKSFSNTAVEFAQLLIDHGADVAAHNNANQRPSDIRWIESKRTFLLAAEEAQRNNHRYKRPRLEDLQPPAAIAAGAEAAAAEEQEEEEDESEDDSDDEEEEED
jgi:ankyrin repeat protein